MRKWIAVVAIGLLFPAAGYAVVPNSMILNEANTVSGGDFLEDDKDDPNFGAMLGLNPPNGRLQGNGQNWLEFLVVQGDEKEGGGFKNTLDLRGWKLEWSYFDLADKHGAGTITFTNDPLWEAVPRGSLITISEWKEVWYLTNTPPEVDPHPILGGLKQEGGINGLGHVRDEAFDEEIHTKLDLKSNPSWNPGINSPGSPPPDWHIHVFGGEQNPDTSFKYFNFSGSITEPDGDDPDFAPDVYNVGTDEGGIFSVNNDDWRITLVAPGATPAPEDDIIVQGPIGEHLPPTNIGINSSEILKIESFAEGTNPTQADYLLTSQGDYNDGSSSTFGDANVWDSGSFSQDLAALRDWILIGDADLDGDNDVDDFILWSSAYPSAIDATWSFGDFDGDGDNDVDDFVHWSSTYPTPPLLGSEITPVPEPATISLALLGGFGAAVMLTRRRRQSGTLEKEAA